MKNNYPTLSVSAPVNFKTTSASIFAEASKKSNSNWLLSLLLFVGMLFNGLSASAQVASYTFAASSGTYTAITGTTYQSGATLNTNAVSAAIPIGFSFVYNGKSYSSLYISNNGYIAFSNIGANAPAAGNVNPISQTSNSSTVTDGYDGAISGFGANLVASASGSPSIIYGASGADFVIQFTDMARTAVTTDRITFQIRLTQTTNVISIVYAAATSSTATTQQPQVGLRGASYYDWKNLSGNSWTAPTVTNTAGTAVSTLAMRFSTTATAAAPVTGQTYTFTPPAALGAPTYAALPATENFDAASWSNGNSTGDLPNANNWRSWPSYGDRSFRRHNITVGSGNGWASTTGLFTVASPASGGTAMFNNYDATSTSNGYMDYYVNFNTAGSKSITFSHISSGTGALNIYLSTDGGATFGSALATYNTSQTSWTTRTVSLGTSTSATCVIRFEAKSAYGSSGSNIGIDNVNVAVITPPTNDLCTTATALPCATSNLAGTTVNATLKTLPATISSLLAGNGVWYSFTGDGASTTITETPSGWDNEMVIVSSPTDCTGTFTVIADRDSGSSGGAETHTFTTVIGTQYYVYIAYYDSTITNITGTFTISRTCTPVITTSVSSLTAFAQTSATPTAQQTYTVSGGGLTADVIVTVPTGYEISTTSGSFVANNTSVTLPRSGTTLASQPVSVFVRLNAATTGTYNGNITHATTGATNVNVSVTGTYISPLSGIKTIDNTGTNTGNNYTSFTNAINALNFNGVGAGGVTFNVVSGQTFTENTPIITATGTLANPIVFQKSGALANPIISSTGTAGSTDAGITINGGDYITFDGIDITIASGSAVEYGYYVRNVSATDGAQNNTIKNTVITLNRANTSSYGIYQNQVSPVATNATGANSSNKYYNFTIKNVYNGIGLFGTSATFPDLNCEVGTTSATVFNTIGDTATPNDLGNGATTVAGINALFQSGIKIFNNEISNVTVTGAVAAYGIYVQTCSGTSNLVYRNKVHDIKTTSTSTSSLLYGIRINTPSVSTVTVYNNFVYGFSHGITTASATLVAFGVANTNTGTANFYHNTVNLNLTAAAASSASLYNSGSGVSVVRNNILLNLSTGGTTSKRYAIYLSSGSLTSNNNDLFVAANTNNFIGFSTSDRTTLANWQAAAGTPDLASISDNPTFVSATDLHLNYGATSNQYESAGASTAITGITDDIDGQTRPGPTAVNGGGTAPDIGADEFDGATLDLTAPAINYTAIPNSAGLTTLAFSGVTITDASGVNSTAGTRPRVYYKKSTNTNAFNDNTNATDGWKWVEANGTTSPFDFTIDLTLINGGVAATNVIQYFVVAQDLASTPNVAINAGSFAAAPASVALTSTAFPIGGSPSSYTILNSISGTITVPGTYPSLTLAGGAFEAINAAVVTGNINIEIAGNLTGENGTVALNAFASPHTIKIYPTTSARSITGTSSTSIIKLNGADRVTIDGSIGGGGTDRSLTITNLSTATSGNGVVWIASASVSNGATDNTIKNCIIAGNATTTTQFGIFAGPTASMTPAAATVALTQNSNTVISNNQISKIQYGVYFAGVSSSALTTGVSISNNTIGNAAVGDGYGAFGIFASLLDSGLISGNAIQNNKNISLGFAPVGATTFNSGIYLQNSKNSTISRNSVFNINVAGAVTSIRVFGISSENPLFNTVGSPSNNTIANNLVYDSKYTGSASSTWQFSGINANGGYGDKFYYNSVYLSGAFGTTSGPNAAFSNGNASTTTVTNNIDVRNNIFYINGTTTVGSYYAYYTTASSLTGSTLNYNDVSSTITGGGTGYVGTINSVAVGSTTITAWRTSTGQEANSISADPLFNSTTNLQPQAGSPVVNAGTAVSVTTDYTGATRSGNTSIGAYESTSDNLAPTIVYTPLTNDCNSGEKNITATITDLSGVPTSGAGLPVLYWKIGAGAYTASTGTFVSNDGNAYTYTFTLGTGSVSGDTISYYIVAQDAYATPNVSVFPSTGAAGLTANVPTAATPPTTPSSYLNRSSLTGTFTVGVGGNYTTLTAAITAYNNACLTGPVTFLLTDSNYSTAESFPIFITANDTARDTNTLTIKPNTGVNTTISALGESLVLYGADYVTIDGSNNGSSSRNMTILNTDSTVDNSSNIWIVGVGSPVDGATNNVVKNLVVTGNAPGVTYAGIEISRFSGDTVSVNSNNTIQNNLITSAKAGVFILGPTLGESSNSVINNTISNIGPASAASSVGMEGIYVANQTNVTISGNTISGVTNSVNDVTTTVSGIIVSGAISGGTVANNKVSNIKCTTGRPSYGIWLSSSSATSGITLSNNVVFDVANNGNQAALNRSSHGIAITTGGGYNLYHNTVNLNSNPTAANTTGNNAALYVASGVTGLNIRNNIFANTQTTAVGRFAIYSDAANTAYTTINYNNYTSASGNLGFIAATARTSIAAIQTGFGQNVNSTAVTPNFTSATDLHLSVASNSGLDNTAFADTGVTTDIDGDTRPAGPNPDMGADEFTTLSCTVATVAVAASTASFFCTSGTATLSATGFTVANGITYEWERSTDFAFTSPISMGAASATYATMSTGVITQTSYYRLKEVCSNDSLNPAYSNVITIDVYTPKIVVVSATLPTICSGTSTSLSATNIASNYSWTSTPAAFTSSVASPSVSPTITTTYNVTGTDSNGCTTASVSTTVTVNQTPSAVIVSSSPTGPLCSGTVVSLTATGGNISSSGQTVFSESFTSGVGTFITVNASSSTSINWAPQANGYLYSTITFSGSTGGFMMANSDSTGASNTTNTQLVSPSINTTGYTNLSLQFKEYLNNSTSTAAAVEISDDNFSTSTSLRNDITNDIGSATTFASTTIAIPSQFQNKTNVKIRFRYEGNYDWYWAVDEVKVVGDLNTTYPITWTASSGTVTPLTASTASATPDPLSTTSITYSATAANGSCTSTGNTSAVVTVNPLPVVTIAPISICQGTAGQLTAVSVTFNTYSWVPIGGGTTLTGQSPMANPAATTTYNVSATDNSTTPACSSITQVTVTVNDPGSINPVGTTTSRVVSPGQLTTFVVNATGTGLTYQWQVNDNVNGWVNIVNDYHPTTNPTGIYSGALTSTLSVNNITSVFNNYGYRCNVKGQAPCTTLTPIEASLTVTSTGFINQPDDVILCGTSTAQFSLTTSGDAPYDLQWQVFDTTPTVNDWINISDSTPYHGLTFTGSHQAPTPVVPATDPVTYNPIPNPATLNVSGITTANNGYQFRCQLDFNLNSAVATLTVNTPVSISSNLSTTPTNVCKVSSTTTNLNITTSGYVGAVTWKYATSAGGTYNDLATNPPAGVTYLVTTPSANNYRLAVTTSDSTPVGSYFYKAFITGGGSGIGKCDDVVTNEATITVNQPSVSITQSATNYCTPGGTAVQLTASGADTYSWSGANLNATNVAIVNATPTVSTVYTVTGTDTNNCTNTAQVTVGVAASFAVTATNATAVSCAGSPVTLGATINDSSYTITTGSNSAKYSFTATSGSFTPLSGGTSSGLAATDDDAISSAITPGFTFNYGGTNYTNFKVDSNGYLVFGSAGTDSNSNDLAVTTSTLRPGLAPLWDDLQCASGVTYQVTGSAGSRVLTIEWLNMEWNYQSSGNTISFQVKLYETTNIIEYVYRQDATAVNTASSGASIGLMGTAATNFISLQDSGSSPTISTSSSLNTITTKPATGQIYRFTPVVTPAYTYAWNGPSSFTSTQAAPTPSPSAASTYNVTVTNPTTGCTASSSILVNVQTTAPSISVHPVAITRCVNGTATFSVTASSTTGLAYQWKKDGNPLSNGGTTSGATSATLTITGVVSGDAGNYTVDVTTCGNLTTPSNPALLTVTALPSVTVNPSSASYCAPGGTAVSLTANGASTYSWAPSTGLSATTGTTVTSSPTTTQTYTVTGTSNSCTNTATVTVTVVAKPQTVTASAASATICSGGSTTLTGSGASYTANQYAFATSTGAALDPMVGATTIISSPAVGSGAGDDTPSSVQSLGFTFNFEGTNYTQYSISPDGWLSFGSATATADYSNGVQNSSNLPKIYPLWDDLSTGTNGNVKVLVTGTAPNRIFIAQWLVTNPRVVAGAANATYQAWLYESTNVIEYRYGTVGTPANASAGLTGKSTSNYQSITFATNASSTSTAQNSNAAAPSSGRMYTFTPPVTTYSWTSATNLVSPTAISTATNALSATEAFTFTITNNGVCSTSATPTTVTVVAQPVANDITPNVAAGNVCAGQSLSATLAGASGGTGTTANVNEFSINGGSTYATYTSGTTINTTSLAGQTVIIRTSRTATGTGCTISPFKTVTWNVVAQPIANDITPNVAAGNVCAGQSLSATFANASGGSGIVTDVQEFSVNGGTSYAPYTGAIDTTTLAGQTIIIRTSRTANGTGCSTSAFKTVTWNVIAQPIANNITPNVAAGNVCAGQTLSATLAGASGGTGIIADVNEFSINGGSTYAAYTSGTTISTTSLGGQTVIIRTSRTATGTGCTISPYKTVTWTVNALPIVTAANVSGCTGNAIALLGSPVGGTYSVANPYTGPSTTYTYSYTDGNGCSATSSAASITVSANVTWYPDADNDGYGTNSSSATTIVSCNNPSTLGNNYASNNTDCVDNNAAINPGVAETNFDGIDNNCSGSIFEGHAPVVVDVTTPSGALATMTATITSSIATNTTPYSGAQVTYKFKVTKTNTPTSVAFVSSNTTSFAFSSASNAAHSSTYDVQATAIVNGEEQPYNGNTTSYSTPAAPTLSNPPTQAGPPNVTCAYTIARIDSYIYANNTTTYGANRYEFLIERMNGATVEQTLSVTTTVPYFKLTNIAGIPATMQVTYGTTYRISVRYGYGATSFGSQIYTAYGTPCLVSTPSLPVASIACGTHLASVNAFVYASGHAAAASQFEFKVTRVSPQQPGELPITVTEEILPRNVANFKLTMLTQLFVGLQKEYSVAVRYTVNAYGSANVSAWTTAPCSLFTPDFPETQIVEAQCGVEGVPSAANQNVYADAVAGATQYRFRLYNAVDAPYTAEAPYDQIIDSPNNYVKLNQFPSLIAGVVYSVTVVAQLNGEYPNIDLAKDCSITAPESTPVGPAKVVVATPFQATAYPNPFANNFMINVKSSSQSVVNLKVYDMIGRLIEQRDARVSDLETATIGDRYPSGVYNVVVSQEDNVQTVRVVKR